MHGQWRAVTRAMARCSAPGGTRRCSAPGGTQMVLRPRRHPNGVPPQAAPHSCTAPGGSGSNNTADMGTAATGEMKVCGLLSHLWDLAWPRETPPGRPHPTLAPGGGHPQGVETAGTYTKWAWRAKNRQWDTHCQRRNRPPRPQGLWTPAGYRGPYRHSVSSMTEGRGGEIACSLSTALGPRHPLDGRLVSAYRMTTGQCATWTRGITRRQ